MEQRPIEQQLGIIDEWNPWRRGKPDGNRPGNEPPDPVVPAQSFEPVADARKAPRRFPALLAIHFVQVLT